MLSSCIQQFTLAASDVRLIENFGAKFKDQTTLHPLGLAMTLLGGIAIFLAPRRYVVIPILVIACFVSSAQRLVILTLDFNLIRILVIIGLIRVLTKREYAGFHLITLDKVIISFAIVKTIVYTAQQGSLSAFVYQGGWAFDSVGLYFLLRFMIREPEDLFYPITTIAVLAIPVSLFFLLEKSTGRNIFSIFGGVSEITRMREGRLRCQGAFAHPIIAGCFWAGWLPLIAALWWKKGHSKFLAIASVIGCITIVICCSSSTPVMGVFAAALAGILFFMRNSIRHLFYATCLLGVALHLSMQAPVWHLISRITIAKGNTSYFRYQLIDNAIHRFDEWALLGTRSTEHWFWGSQDITNQYIFEGIRGGAATLGLFVASIVIAYIYIGRSWRVVQADRMMLAFAWSLGAALFVHNTNFVGVTYFGQGTVIWYIQLAMVASFYQIVVEGKIMSLNGSSTKSISPTSRITTL